MTQSANGQNTVPGYQEAFYNAYTPMMEQILQENKRAYSGAVMQEVIEGENQAYDFVGTIELDQKTSRFEDIPIQEMEHTRRWISPEWYRKGIFVDKEDDIALLMDPTSSYIQALGLGEVRKENDVINAAWFGTVQGGKLPGDSTYSFTNSVFTETAGTGGRTIVHDAKNNYAAGGTSTGLTIEKLILAREALIQLKNDPNEEMYIACNPRQLSDLLRQAETQSIDTNIVRSLVNGSITKYMGFNFIIDYNISLGSSNDADSDTNVYELPCWTKTGMLFARHQTPILGVDWLPRKQIWQVSARTGMNAIRRDEDRVLKIECVATV